MLRFEYWTDKRWRWIMPHPAIYQRRFVSVTPVDGNYVDSVALLSQEDKTKFQLSWIINPNWRDIDYPLPDSTLAHIAQINASAPVTFIHPDARRARSKAARLTKVRFTQMNSPYENFRLDSELTQILEVWGLQC